MNTNRRAFLGGASTAALLSTSGVALAQKKYDDGAFRQRDQDQPYQSLQRPAVGL